MNIVERVVAKFGGDAAMSRKMEKATGRAVHPTTIQYWRRCGHFPVKRQPDVLATAEAEGLDVTAEDVIAPMEAAE